MNTSPYTGMTVEDIHRERNLDCTIEQADKIEQAVIEAWYNNCLLDEDNIVEYVLNHVPDITEHDARVVAAEFLDFSEFVSNYTTP